MRRPGLAAFYACCAVFLMLFSHAELIKANDVFSVPWEALLGLAVIGLVRAMQEAERTCNWASLDRPIEAAYLVRGKFRKVVSS